MKIAIEKGQLWEDPVGNSWEVLEPTDLVGTVVLRRGPILIHVSSDLLESESGWKLLQGA